MANRVVLGKRNNGNYGLFISPPGVDANTANDYDLSFSSNLGHGANVHAKGMIGPLVSTSFVTASFPALSYVPLVMVGFYDPVNGFYYYFQREDSAYFLYNPSGSGSGSYAAAVGPIATVTTSSISMKSYRNSGWYGHYTILRTPGGF